MHSKVILKSDSNIENLQLNEINIFPPENSMINKKFLALTTILRGKIHVLENNNLRFLFYHCFCCC